MNHGNTFENEKARLDLINRMVEKSMKKDSSVDKENFYSRNVEKVKDFTLEDCIEMLLDGKNQKPQAPTEVKPGQLPVLRPFETVDFEALTKGFEAEDVKEGTLVLYITEAQLLQLLNQRAIIVPDKSRVLSSLTEDKRRMSLVDNRIKENLGRASPVDKVELVIEKEKTEDAVERTVGDIIADMAAADQQMDNVSNQRRSSKSRNKEEEVDRKIEDIYADIINKTIDESKFEKRTDKANVDSRKNSVKYPQLETSVEYETNLRPNSKRTHSPSTSLGEILKTEDSNARSSIARDLIEQISNNEFDISSVNDQGGSKTHSGVQKTYSPTTTLGEILKTEDSNARSSIVRDLIEQISNNEFDVSSVNNQKVLVTFDGTEALIFDDFLNKTFGKELLEEFKQAKVDEKVTNLLSNLFDNIIEESNTNQAYFKHPALEKGKVFEKFYSYISSLPENSHYKRQKSASSASTESIKQDLEKLYDKSLFKSGKKSLQAESIAQKNLKFLGDFVERALDKSPAERLFSDKLSDEGLNMIKNYVLKSLGDYGLVDESSRSSISDTYSYGPEARIFDAFVENVFGHEVIQRFRDQKKIDRAYNLIQDLIDYSIFSTLKNNSNLEPITERGLIFKKFFEVMAARESMNRKQAAGNQCFQKALETFGQLFTDSTRVADKESTPAEKLLLTFGDFVNRVMDNKDRALTNSESDYALSKIREYVFDCFCDQSQASSETHSTLFDQFLNSVFPKSLSKIIEQNLIDCATNRLQDLIDDSFEKASTDLNLNKETVEKASVLKDFARVQGPKMSQTFIRTRQSKPDAIKKVQHEIGQVVDKSKYLTDKERALSDASKTLKTFADFIDKTQNRPDRLLTDGLLREAFGKITDHILNDLEGCCSEAYEKEQKKIFNKFTNELFTPEALSQLVDVGLIDCVNNKIQDLVDDSFKRIEKDAKNVTSIKKAEPFNDFAKLQGPVYNKNFVRQRVGSPESIKETQKEIAAVFDKAENLNGAETISTDAGKRLKDASQSERTSSDAEKHPKVFGDFVDRAKNKPDRLMSDDLSREALGKIKSYVLNDLKTGCPDAHVAQNKKIFDKFVNGIFGPESLKKVINGNLIDHVNNKIQDLVDDTFKTAEIDGTDRTAIKKAEPFKDYANLQGPKLFQNFTRQRIASPDSIKIAQKDIAKVLDKSPRLSEIERTALSDVGKTLKVLGDFIDRVENRPESRLLTTEKSDEALGKITDFILRDIIQRSPASTSRTTNDHFSTATESLVSQFPDSTVVSFPDFDLLVPSAYQRQTTESMTGSYKLPPQYEFLGPQSKASSARRSEFYAVKDEETENRKIIIKTVRRIPGKTCPPPVDNNCKQVKKKITYSYLDNYTPSTRVYEVLDFDANTQTDQTTRDLFNINSKSGSSMQPFDKVIESSISKPSVKQINDYLSIINTGVDKNSDLVQIHPLLNSSSYVKHQDGAAARKETVKIESDEASYDAYYSEIEKHFNGLRITDFPLYVQGLEFRHDSENPENNDPRGLIVSNENEHSKGISTELGLQSELFTKQTVNNVDNIQYVRVNSENQLIKTAQ